MKGLWIVVALAVGLGGGYMLASRGEMASAPAVSAPEREVLFYRNPMNPTVTSRAPAKDNMGMDYIPVYAGETGGEPGLVSIDPVTVQNIGVRTAKVQRRTLTRLVRAVGRVAFDEERVTRLHPKTEGWIEELYVDTTGEPVGSGTILMGIYSPQLVSTQEEYVLALANAEALAQSRYPDIRRGARELLTSTRARLSLLDVPQHQIHELEVSGKVLKTLHLHSPFDGVVLNIGARQGQFVTPATELYTIADLSKVWVYVDVFESDLPWVAAGDEAEMRLISVPGRVFRGRIAYLYPYAEADTRTVKVRLEFDNPDLALRPEQFADVTVHAARRVDALVVPSEAVVRSGPRDQLFVVRAPGKFEPREVTLGVSSDGWVQVLSGVREGERVVTSSQFLIDSESKLDEATAKMLDAGPAANAPGHGGPGRAGGSMRGDDSVPMKGHDMGPTR